MSMQLSGETDPLLGTPELAPIGKRIEMLRIGRGISKQQLAKAAGISRQQLWRVLAGKSELTSSLRERLAFVLRTDVAALQADGADGAGVVGWHGGGGATIAPDVRPATATLTAAQPATMAEFIASPGAVQALLALIPAGDDGLALKRAVLDAIEDVAMARGLALPVEFFEVRRAVISRTI